MPEPIGVVRLRLITVPIFVLLLQKYHLPQSHNRFSLASAVRG
jgi:hypothetical protein